MHKANAEQPLSAPPPSEQPNPPPPQKPVPPPPPSVKESDPDLSELCRLLNDFMWGEVAIFRTQISPNLGLASTVYLWEAYFYCAVRVIHNRAIAEQIYALTDLNPTARAAYRRFRKVIHRSGIDLRTSAGISLLWSLTRPWVSQRAKSLLKHRSNSASPPR